MFKSLCLFSLILLASCSLAVPKFATEEQKKQVMHDATFDQALISGINQYDDLKNFLLTYGDTIILYRNNKNHVIKVGGGGKTDTVLYKQECYNFFEGNSNYDIKNVPDFLQLKLDSIYKAIGYIESFEVCQNRKITIQIRSEDRKNGLYTSHNLLWNTEIERDYAYADNKDTLLKGNCIYRIGMTEHHGH
jgi:hypothetical protein